MVCAQVRLSNPIWKFRKRFHDTGLLQGQCANLEFIVKLELGFVLEVWAVSLKLSFSEADQWARAFMQDIERKFGKGFSWLT